MLCERVALKNYNYKKDKKMVFLSIIFISLYVLPICIIAMIQIAYIKAQNEVVILSKDDFEIAKNYAITMQIYSIIEAIWSGVLFIFWANLGLHLLLNLFGANLSSAVFGAIFVVIFLAINAIFTLPLDAYKSLIIDKSFGFSKMSGGLFAVDFLKSFVMTLIFGFVIAFALVWLIENIVFWWIWGFVLMLFVAIGANIIYPLIIAPIFNKFMPLADEALKSRIEGIMQRVGFKANGIFVMDASKRDGRLNAYFGGFGKAKRVVLFDTLLSKVSQNELLAILGHELGHFKHKDLLKNICIMAFVLFALFFIAGNLPQWLFADFENGKNGALTLCVLILIANLISFYFMPIINFFSRKAEYKADEFGANLTNKADLRNALAKLVSENKAFPYSHRIFVFFYMSHPPLIERLRALE